MSSVKLTKDELQSVLTTLDRFPDSHIVTIVSTPTGVGNVLEVLFDTTINGISGVFKVDLTDTSKW
jgi:hypothetical protein